MVFPLSFFPPFLLESRFLLGDILLEDGVASLKWIEDVGVSHGQRAATASCRHANEYSYVESLTVSN